jgi:transposase
VTAVADRSIEDGGRGPKELTGMVDLTRDQHGQVHARLPDLVPGRSGQAYRTWVVERGEAFRAGVKIATLDPFQATRTPSTTSSRTPSPCSTRSMS